MDALMITVSASALLPRSGNNDYISVFLAGPSWSSTTIVPKTNLTTLGWNYHLVAGLLLLCHLGPTSFHASKHIDQLKMDFFQQDHNPFLNYLMSGPEPRTK